MKPFQFIHITDTHMNAPGKAPTFFTVNMADKLMDVFKHVHKSNIHPDFIVITGDLSHEGDKEDYSYIKTVVDEGSQIVGAPVYVTLGNHDHRAPFYEGYLGEQQSEKPYYYSTMIGGLRLIGLNSQVPGKHSGAVDEEQVAWLAQQLQTPAPEGTIVALHHPLLDLNIMPAKYMVENCEEVVEVLKNGDVIGVFAGHVHSNNVGTYEGLLSVAASGTAFGGERIADDEFRLYDYCSYNVVTIQAKNVTVQTVVLPSTDTEFKRYSPTFLTTH
jgi:Icc protein